MLYAPHFLTGAAILKAVPNPAVGLPLAFLSHILLDLTPHHDFDIHPGVTSKEILNYPLKRKIFLFGTMGLDAVLLLISLLWVVITYKNYWLLVGGVVGIVPDLVEQVFSLALGKALPGWQDKLQWRVSAKYGFISYPVISLIGIVVLTV